MSNKAYKLTASGKVYDGPCVLYGVYVGPDGSNDPTLSVFNNTVASGDEVLPTATFQAAQGLQGVTLPEGGVDCPKGVYGEITLSAGSVEIIFYIKPKQETEENGRN